MIAYAARGLLAALVVAAAVLAVPAPAGACTCEVSGPAEMLARADAAFVGTAIGPPVAVGDVEVDWPFRVAEWVKGGGAGVVTVRSAADTAACGLGAAPGARMGLLVDEDDGLLRSGMCSTIDPAVLAAAAKPAGPLDGEGPAALLVGGAIGPYSLVALDAEGRDVARVEWGEPVTELSVCPGARFAAEVAGDATLAVRSLRTFEVVWQQALPGVSPWYSSVRCVTTGGDGVLALATDTATSPRTGLAVRATPDGVTVLAEGPWLDGVLTDAAAVVVNGAERTGVARVDLATGDITQLFEVDPGEGFGDVDELRLSPDGTRVAFQSRTRLRDTGTSAIHVADVVTGEILTLEGAGGVSLWLDDATLLDATSSPPALLYSVDDGAITLAGTRDWRLTPVAVAGSTIYGTGAPGGVIEAADRDGGEVRTLRVLPALEVMAVAAPVGAPVAEPTVIASLEGDVGEADYEPAATTTPTPSTTTTTVAPAPPTTVEPHAAPVGGGGGAAPWVALGVAAAAVLGAVWLGRRRRATG